MKIRSKLTKYTASAINPDTGERDTWDVWFTGNNPDDRRFWLKMANTGGFKDIRLTKHTGTTKPKADKAVIALEGLKLLDALIAKRRAQTA